MVKVITCGFPPLEERDKSLKSLAQHDFFGGGTLTKEETVSLIKIALIQITEEILFMVLKFLAVALNYVALIVLFLYTSIAQTCRVGKAISK